MSKPIILSVPCGSNVVSAKKFLIQDGAGAMAQLGASGTPKGVSISNKDTANNVGMIIQGLVNLPAAAAAYNVGDVLGANSSGVVAYSSGVRVGIAGATKTVSTTYSSTDQLVVYLNMDYA
jgi:hypothetical protein